MSQLRKLRSTILNMEESKTTLQQIEEHNAAKLKLKRLIPLGTLVMLAFGLITPMLPFKGLRKPMAESIGYPIAAAICVAFAFGIYIISYRVAINRHNKEIERLKKG